MHLLLCYFLACRLQFSFCNETLNVMTTCPTERSLLLGFCWHNNVCCSNGMYSLWVESLISYSKMSLSTPINSVQILTYSCSVTFLWLHEYFTKTSKPLISSHVIQTLLIFKSFLMLPHQIIASKLVCFFVLNGVWGKINDFLITHLVTRILRHSLLTCHTEDCN